MHVTFTITFDDYREANRADKLGVRKQNPWGSRLIIPAGTAAAVMVAVLTPFAARAHSTFGLIAADLLIPAPFLVFLASVLTRALIGTRAQRNMPRHFLVKDNVGRTQRWWIALLIWLYVFGALVWLSAQAPPPWDTDESGAASWAIGLAPRLPWILLFGILLAYVQGISAGGVKRAWLALTNVHRVQEVEISAEKIVISTGASTLEYRWEEFPCCGESRNLFLLYNSMITFFMIPKRGFADESQLTAFRHILQHHQLAGQPPIVGFPVTPLEQPTGGGEEPTKM